ncbi:MAG: hypothetical protein ACRCTZ_16100 [Sarcina sp.]
MIKTILGTLVALTFIAFCLLILKFISIFKLELFAVTMFASLLTLGITMIAFLYVVGDASIDFYRRKRDERVPKKSQYTCEIGKKLYRHGQQIRGFVYSGRNSCTDSRYLAKTYIKNDNEIFTVSVKFVSFRLENVKIIKTIDNTSEVVYNEDVTLAGDKYWGLSTSMLWKVIVYDIWDKYYFEKENDDNV